MRITANRAAELAAGAVPSGQLSIFEPGPPVFPRARTNDAIGSHDAAAKIERTGHAHCVAARVLDAVRQYPGRTTQELCAAAGLDVHSAGRRLPELASEKVALVRRVEFTRAEAPTSNDVRCAISGARAIRWWPA